MIHIQRVNFQLQINAVCMFGAAEETTEQRGATLGSFPKCAALLGAPHHKEVARHTPRTHTSTTDCAPSRDKEHGTSSGQLALSRDRSCQIWGQEQV